MLFRSQVYTVQPSGQYSWYGSLSKKNKNKTDRTLGKMVKAKLYRQNHTKKHTHTHSQNEKKEKNRYILAPKVHRLNFGMICFLFRYSTDAGYIKLIVAIYSAAPEAAGRNFPFSSLFAQLLGFSFGFGPASACRSPEGVCSSLRQIGRASCRERVSSPV